jgi:hypothetical protein
MTSSLAGDGGEDRRVEREGVQKNSEQPVNSMQYLSRAKGLSLALGK